MADMRLILSLYVIVITCFVYVQNEEAKNPCGSNQLPCDDYQQCIGREKWCDNTTDCKDETDEKYCQNYTTSYFGFRRTTPFSCSDKHFRCNSGPCFPISIECDGFKNCEDGSDEYLCYKTETTSERNIDFTDLSTTFNVIHGDFQESSTTDPKTTNPSFLFSTFTHNNIFETSFTTLGSTILPTLASTSYVTFSEKPSTSESTIDSRRPLIDSPTTLDPEWIRTTTVDYYSKKRADFAQNTNYKSPSTPLRTNYGISKISRRSSNKQQQTYRQFNVMLRRKTFHSAYRFPTPQRTSPQQARFTNGQQYLSPINKSTAVLSPFLFIKNYTEEFDDQYTDTVQAAEQYLYDERDDSSYSWGKDSPRALIALSLISNSFLSSDPEKNLMKKRLQADLGTKLLEIRSVPSRMSSVKLASYINALLATCENPKDFLGQDLTAILQNRLKSRSLDQNRMNPFIILTLCLTNSTISRNELHELRRMTVATETQDEASKDAQILATTALSCFQHYDEFKYELKGVLEVAFQTILQSRREDGSFGSLHSTALAAQALMSSNIPIFWDAQKTVDYLSTKQESDGSFGSMLGTYLVLPVLKGRTLLHIRNTQCDPIPKQTASAQADLNASGPKKTIYYTLKVGNPVTSSTSMILNVPAESNVLDIMLIAEKLNQQFSFTYNEKLDKVDVNMISGIPNDPELGHRWHLYRLDGYGSEYVTIDLHQEEFIFDIRDLKPLDSDELIYWYMNLS